MDLFDKYAINKTVLRVVKISSFYLINIFRGLEVNDALA